jgi:hypothetical protein
MNRIFYMDPDDINNPAEFDDFHSPIDPEGYIRHRLAPRLEFYRSRLAPGHNTVTVAICTVIACCFRVPKSSFKHVASQFALLATSAGTFAPAVQSALKTHAPAAASLLSFLSFTNYVGIVTVAASSLSAFIEFSAAPQKLGRYSASIVSLSASLNWWASLSDIMKKDRKNVSRFISDCEQTYVFVFVCVCVCVCVCV